MLPRTGACAGGPTYLEAESVERGLPDGGVGVLHAGGPQEELGARDADHGAGTADGQCVEVAQNPRGIVAIRDSKDPDG